MGGKVDRMTDKKDDRHINDQRAGLTTKGVTPAFVARQFPARLFVIDVVCRFIAIFKIISNAFRNERP
jgi:hypothetical protein